MSDIFSTKPGEVTITAQGKTITFSSARIDIHPWHDAQSFWGENAGGAAQPVKIEGWVVQVVAEGEDLTVTP